MLRAIQNHQIVSANLVADRLCEFGLASACLHPDGSGNYYLYQITDDGERYFVYQRMYRRELRWTRGLAVAAIV